MRIKKGDTVIVISGKDKNKKGKVVEVFTDEESLIVERVNVAKRHLKPTRDFAGGIIEKALPLKACKVMLVCPRCNEPSRVKKQRTNKVLARVCGRCKEVVDKV